MADSGFDISASIGYSVFEQAPASTSDALHRVDLAMYAAKAAGIGCVVDAHRMNADAQPIVGSQEARHPTEEAQTSG